MQKKGFQTFLRNFSKKFSIYSYLPTTKSFFTDKSANFRFRFAITFRPCYFTLKSQFQKYWLSRVNHLFFRASKPFRRTNPDFFTKNGKKSNFGPFSSSPVNAGCSRYPVVYVSLISSIQAC